MYRNLELNSPKSTVYILLVEYLLQNSAVKKQIHLPFRLSIQDTTDNQLQPVSLGWVKLYYTL